MSPTAKRKDVETIMKEREKRKEKKRKNKKVK
jgi:hypothetical protein